MRVHVRGAILGLLTDGVAALGFAVGWGLVWQRCAPPSPLCLLPGHACTAVCSDGWAQFPGNTLFGLALGLVPALFLFVAIQVALRPPALASPLLRRGLGLSLAGVFLASLGMDLLFLSYGAFENNLMPWAVLGLAAVAFLAGTVRLHRLRKKPPR